MVAKLFGACCFQFFHAKNPKAMQAGVAALELAIVGSILAAFTLVFTNVLIPTWRSLEDDITLEEVYLNLGAYRIAPVVLSEVGGLEFSAPDYVHDQGQIMQANITQASGQEACVFIYVYTSSALDCDPDVECDPAQQNCPTGVLNLISGPTSCVSVPIDSESCLGKAFTSLIIGSGCSSERYYLGTTSSDPSHWDLCATKRIEGSMQTEPGGVTI